MILGISESAVKTKNRLNELKERIETTESEDNQMMLDTKSEQK